MHSDVAKCDGIKSDLIFRWPRRHILGQNLTTRHRIIKSKNGIGLSSSKNLTGQNLIYTASSSTRTRYTQVQVATRWIANTTTMRERTRRASPQPDYNYE